MTTIANGSCIGIKFSRKKNEKYCSHKDKSMQYCVHNGRFLYAIVNGKNVLHINTDVLDKVEAIIFTHAGHCTQGKAVIHSIKVVDIKDVKIIPAFSHIYKDIKNPQKTRNIKEYCKGFRPGSKYYNGHKHDLDKILPTQCISVCYKKADGKIGVHNGRYLYWQDKTLKHHCVLNNSDKPFRIWYSHMIFNEHGNLVPELKYRENIHGFSKL